MSEILILGASISASLAAAWLRKRLPEHTVTAVGRLTNVKRPIVGESTVSVTSRFLQRVGLGKLLAESHFPRYALSYYYKRDIEAPEDPTYYLSESPYVLPELVAKGDDAWRLHRQLNTSFIGFGSDTPGTNDNLSGTTAIADGAWHHVAIVYGADVKQIYVDGQLDASQGYPGPLRVTGEPVVLGNNVGAGPRFFHGTLDEVRISRVARSAAWIALQARATADASIVSVGAEETCP